MAMYPTHDVLIIKKQKNGDLHFENDSFWSPSFTKKLISEFLETHLKSAESESGCSLLNGCMNSFIIPQKYTKEFYSHFGDKISNNILTVKTNYNK